MADGGTTDRTIVPAKNEADCKTNVGFSWLADRNTCASDCRSPGLPSWNSTRNVPICIVPQGVHIDDTGARSDINAHGEDPNVTGGPIVQPNTIQDKATEAVRQTDVFYRDSKSGVEIPSSIPTGYLITAAIGLSLGFLIFRR
jgi:hypothetical protein